MNIIDYLNDIDSKIITISHTLVDMVLLFSLKDFDKPIRLAEEESEDLSKLFLMFKTQYEDLIHCCNSFFKALKENDYPKNPLTSNGLPYIKYTDNTIKNTIELCTDIFNTTKDNISKKEQDILKNAYFAYLIIVRCFNSFIHIYNTSMPKNNIPELKNIPDPKYLDEIFNLNSFIRKYDTFEKLMKLLKPGNF